MFALLLGACGDMGTGGGRPLCAIPPRETLAQALGAPVTRARPLEGVDLETCVWTGGAPEETPPRTVTASIWREDGLRNATAKVAGALYFEDRLHDLENQSTQTRALGGMGDAAVIGFGQVGDERFTGGIVVRKGKAVLVMRASGADPAAFEQAARAIVRTL